VLLEFVLDERVAVITLNRPHADIAITTKLAVQFIEVLETIAARPSVRVAILTAAGDRAFSVGGDLYQRKQMTKEEWLRQRQVFDRVVYAVRQLRGRSSPPCMAWPTAVGVSSRSAPTSSSPPTPGPRSSFPGCCHRVGQCRC
jgi:hypothetical protein